MAASNAGEAAPVETVSQAAARRIVLAAQGFCQPGHKARNVGEGTPPRVTMRQFQSQIDRLALLQIDSVNVLTRAHHMPVFSRLGPYDQGLLYRALGKHPRRLVEYWAHEASLVSPRTHGLLRFRMEAAEHNAWGGLREVARNHPQIVELVLEEIARSGPLTAAEVELNLAQQADLAERKGNGWAWSWSLAKRALEYLFWSGKITSAGRNSQFARVYDLTERVIPDERQQTHVLGEEDAITELVATAARALGIATEPSLRDFFRLSPAQSKSAVARLVEAGALRQVRIEGVDQPAYLDPAAARPRKVDARALISPFDSLIFDRKRVEQLFDFRYRIEIYVPQAKRQFGYYVLPFLLGERLVARLDLKADRQAGKLMVQAAHSEPAAPEETASELAKELRLMASWLGLGAVQVNDAGDLARALKPAVKQLPQLPESS